jgi:hypothetical protein
MKSFIFALLLLLAVSLFATVHSVRTVARIDNLLKLADTLPTSEEAITASSAVTENVTALIALWDREFPAIAFSVGYQNTDRCDEAIGALAVHFRNNNGADFTVALTEFRDSLCRLRILEGFHPEGIF